MVQNGGSAVAPPSGHSGRANSCKYLRTFSRLSSYTLVARDLSTDTCGPLISLGSLHPIINLEEFSPTSAWCWYKNGVPKIMS